MLWMQPKKLLCGLLFVKFYSAEEVHAVICSCNKNTLRRCSWRLTTFIATLTEDVVNVCYKKT